MWPLSREWYGDRLEPGYRTKPAAKLQAMLSRAGLTGDFWMLA